MKFPREYRSVQQQIGAEDVQMRTEDGVQLHGWFVRVPDSRLVTLHLHGNAGNVTHRAAAAMHILQAGSSVLLLDYRGYGRSAGSPSERGLYADARAGYDFLRKLGYEPKNIVLHGESLGTAVATKLATERECAGLVLEAPFPSARAMAGHVLPLLGPLLTWGFDTRSRIAAVRCPVMVIHGDRDSIIPYRFGKQVYDAAPEPKSMWTINGGDHNDMHQAGAAQFVARLRAFYATL
jgi:fermentation-respiration switch protein FrsA (DUF1100 family)